jgi:hypothetical protein
MSAVASGSTSPRRRAILQCSGEHLQRDGFFAGDSVLQGPLFRQAQAAVEELLLVDGSLRVKIDQLFGDHPVGVDERAKHQVRD